LSRNRGRRTGSVKGEVTYLRVPDPDQQRAGEHLRRGPGQANPCVAISHHDESRAVIIRTGATPGVRGAGLAQRPGVGAQPSQFPVPAMPGVLGVAGGGQHRRLRPRAAQRAEGAQGARHGYRMRAGRCCRAGRWCRAGDRGLERDNRGYPDRDRHGCEVAGCLAYQWRQMGPITRSARRPAGTGDDGHACRGGTAPDIPTP